MRFGSFFYNDMIILRNVKRVVKIIQEKVSLRGHLRSMHKEKYEELCGAEKEREQGKLKYTTSVTPLQQAKK